MLGRLPESQGSGLMQSGVPMHAVGLLKASAARMCDRFIVMHLFNEPRKAWPSTEPRKAWPCTAVLITPFVAQAHLVSRQ